MSIRTLPLAGPTRVIDAVFLRDVLAGLSRPSKHLPCMYLYDERGSALFEEICTLPEYYLTRCELAILERHAGEMADLLGAGCALVEYGSGSGRKTRLLLDHLEDAWAYIPVDVSREPLYRMAGQLAREYPHVAVTPLCADFTRPFALPRVVREGGRRAVYFSGSTIGNFQPAEATGLLAHVAELVGPGGGLLIGVDLKKPKDILEPAYDDARGVTAAFNLNLLARINRELGADFVLKRFRHRAFYDEAHGRIEMHLVSLAEQTVRLAGQCFALAEGETICTEYSHKYSFGDFRALAEVAGLAVRRVWTDEQGLFSVQYAEALPRREARREP
jgi:dimethylhistidine N-methyltransferase